MNICIMVVYWYSTFCVWLIWILCYIVVSYCLYFYIVCTFCTLLSVIVCIFTLCVLCCQLLFVFLHCVYFLYLAYYMYLLHVCLFFVCVLSPSSKMEVIKYLSSWKKLIFVLKVSTMVSIPNFVPSVYKVFNDTGQSIYVCFVIMNFSYVA